MRFAFALLAALACSAGASAGVVLTMEQSSGRDGAPREILILLDRDRLKLPNPPGAVIYRGDEDKAWTIDDERKTYMEITRQSMGAMRTQMDAAMAQARAQIANLPPEQRKMVEEMMAKQGVGGAGAPPAAPANVTFQKAGSKRTVGKWPCEGYTRLEDGRKTDDLCIARIGDLGLAPDDLKAFAGLAGLLQGAGGAARSAAQPMNFEAISKAIGYDGMPVHNVHYGPSGASIETTVKAIDRRAIPREIFEPPAGYTRREMPQMPPGR